ncbi:MAG: S9 family peptidase [Deltaproteobacteria bacterium]|nr:S9 family peptidase [Deltaproteobacteria bacterium]
MAGVSTRLGFPTATDDGSLWWLESRPSEGGRGVVVRRDPGGRTEDALPPPHSARSRVHEYGGRPYLVDGATFYFVQDRDQQLWRKRPGEEPTRLTDATGYRFAEPILDRERGRLIAVAERHAPEDQPEPPEAENLLVAISLADGAVTPLARGRDFYAAPALSPDGGRLAFLAWDHPHMPWDAAELHLAELDGDGACRAVKRVAGDTRGSAFQPVWSPAGDLYFSLEVDGYWTLHVAAAEGPRLLLRTDAEFGAPLWQLGTELFAFSGPRELVAACFERGLSRVGRILLDPPRFEPLVEDLLHVGQLACHGPHAALLVGWAGSGTRLLHLDLRGGAIEIARDTVPDALGEADISSPEAVSFPTLDGETAHGFFFAPRHREFVAPPGERPPLLVMAHGGPTACTSPTLNLGVQYWTSRGFAVLDVNYRGSTGYGRAYRERLRGEWGILDVGDCVAGARHLADTGRVDGRRMVIRGGSAGGYTVLQALANHDVFAAGSCLYGVTDLEGLARDTHKFESRYDRFLVDGPGDRGELLRSRSPRSYPERIRRPVIFFQGMEDKAVPPEQADTMVDALQRAGVTVEYHLYAGEQHGFRRRETLRHVLEAELAFFQRVLGLAEGR